MCVAPTPDQLLELSRGLAGEAARRDDPPVGAVLVSPHGEVVVMASNREISTGDPTAHAELLLLREAAATGIAGPLGGYIVAISAEPCPTCAAALTSADVGRLITPERASSS